MAPRDARCASHPGEESGAPGAEPLRDAAQDEATPPTGPEGRPERASDQGINNVLYPISAKSIRPRYSCRPILTV